MLVCDDGFGGEVDTRASASWQLFAGVLSALSRGLAIPASEPNDGQTGSALTGCWSRPQGWRCPSPCSGEKGGGSSGSLATPETSKSQRNKVHRSNSQPRDGASGLFGAPTRRRRPVCPRSRCWGSPLLQHLHKHFGMLLMPLKIFRPVVSSAFSSALLAAGISVVSRALVTT